MFNDQIKNVSDSAKIRRYGFVMGKWVFAKVVCVLLSLTILSGPVTAFAVGSMTGMGAVSAPIVHADFELQDKDMSRVSRASHKHAAILKQVFANSRSAAAKVRNCCCTCDRIVENTDPRSEPEFFGQSFGAHASAVASAPIFSLLRPPRA